MKFFGIRWPRRRARGSTAPEAPEARNHLLTGIALSRLYSFCAAGITAGTPREPASVHNHNQSPFHYRSNEMTEQRILKTVAVQAAIIAVATYVASSGICLAQGGLGPSFPQGSTQNVNAVNQPKVTAGSLPAVSLAGTPAMNPAEVLAASGLPAPTSMRLTGAFLVNSNGYITDGNGFAPYGIAAAILNPGPFGTPAIAFLANFAGSCYGSSQCITMDGGSTQIYLPTSCVAAVEGQFLGFVMGRVGCADAGLIAEVAYIVDTNADTFTAQVYFAFPGATSIWSYKGAGKGQRIRQ